MRFLLFSIVFAAFFTLSGCAYVGPSPDAKAKERYETYGPKFTEEQKAQLSDEEKVNIYNNEVREKDRLVCRKERVTGSHFLRTRCFTREEMQQARTAAEMALRDAQRPTVTGGN